MALLALAALVWIGVHVGIAGTALRARLVARLGEGGFRALFSLLSVAAIVFLVLAWRRAPLVPLWTAPDWLRWVIAAAMLAAFELFVGAFAAPSPTAVGGESALARAPRGWLRVTRHPMLWSFALWAAAHVAGNGDMAAVLFFGAFLVTALAGMPSIDAKVARRDPRGWEEFARRTSILPFGAIAARRNRFVASEIGWFPPLVAAVAWGIVLRYHPVLFGVPALPLR